MKRFLEIIKRNSGRVQTSLSTLLKIGIILSIFYSTYFHLWHVLYANIFMLFLLFMPLILKKKYEVYIPREFELIIMFFVIISFFLGDFRGLVIQAFFGITMGFIGFAIMLILFANSKLKKNYFVIVVFAFSVAISLGLFAELTKYYLKFFLNYSFNAGDYSYAMISLSLVSVGALLSSLIGFLYMKGYRFGLMKEMIGEFKIKNPRLFIEKTDSPEEVLKIIKNGEGERVEFKSTLRKNLHIGEHDKKVENSVLKTLVAFLNSDGGTLLIGVSDDREIIGIEKDDFENNDKFNRHLTNLLKERIGNEFLPYMGMELIIIEGKTICCINCSKSDNPVFLKSEGNEEFYIRVGASSLVIYGKKLLEYINNKFMQKL